MATLILDTVSVRPILFHKQIHPSAHRYVASSTFQSIWYNFLLKNDNNYDIFIGIGCVTGTSTQWRSIRMDPRTTGHDSCIVLHWLRNHSCTWRHFGWEIRWQIYIVTWYFVDGYFHNSDTDGCWIRYVRLITTYLSNHFIAFNDFIIDFSLPIYLSIDCTSLFIFPHSFTTIRWLYGFDYSTYSDGPRRRHNIPRIECSACIMGAN